MKAEQKRKLAAVIAIVLIVAMVLSAALPIFWASTSAAQNAQDYTIEATVGFDGTAKLGCEIPVNVTVTNNTDKAFEGEVAVNSYGYAETMTGTRSQITQYAKAVELAANGSVSVSLNVPVSSIQRNVKVMLLHDGKSVAETETALEVSSDDDVWVGALSENAEDLSYLQPSYYSSQGDVLDLAGAVKESSITVPIDSFDIFVVNDYDLSALSSEQLGAVSERISDGAVMLLGKRVSSLDKLGLDAAAKHTVAGDGYTYSTYTYGNGEILVAGCDLAVVSSTNERQEMLLSLFDTGKTTYYGNSDNDTFIAYTNRLPNLTDKTINVIMAVVYIYIAFIPIMYLVLKKKDKRENAIKIIPAAAIIASVLIYLISFNTVYKKPIASVINYINLNLPVGSDTSFKSYMNVVAPVKGNVVITAEKPASVISVGDTDYDREAYSWDMTVDDEVYTKLVFDDNGDRVEKHDQTMWDNTYLTFNSNADIKGGFDCTPALSDNSGYTCTVVNNSGVDMNEMFVILHSNDHFFDLQRFTDVKSGDAVSIDPVDISSLDDKDIYSYDDVINPNQGALRTENLNESYRFETEDDILTSTVNGVNGYVTGGNTVTLDALRVTVVGFSTDDSLTPKTAVNKKSVNSSTLDIFRQDTPIEVGDDVRSTFSLMYGYADHYNQPEDLDENDVDGGILYAQD